MATLARKLFNAANTVISPLKLQIIPIKKFRLTETALSPELSGETEIVCDNPQTEANDLWRYFRNNTRRDLHKWHHYFEIYDHWFSDYRANPSLKILEIGVSLGGSLKMWRGYFHPEAVIVGVDFNPECKAHEDSSRNIFVEIGDQADISFLRRVNEKYGPFDIIIDDGGHTTRQQTVTFNYLYPAALKYGGVYLVEDTQTSYWSRFCDASQSFVSFAKSLVDRLYEPYLQNQDEPLFRIGLEGRKLSLNVSTFCADTRSVCFYDGVIVFEKRRRSMPTTEHR